MILLAVQDEQGDHVYVYSGDKKNFVQTGQLYNYTSDFVAIKRGTSIYLYNELGDMVAKYPYDFVDVSNSIGTIL